MKLILSRKGFDAATGHFETLNLPGVNLPGGGVFPRFHEGLRLTDPDSQCRRV